MKKTYFITAALILSLALTACGSSKSASPSVDTQETPQTNQTLSNTSNQSGITQDSIPSTTNNTQDQNIQVSTQENGQSESGPVITLEKFRQVQNGISYVELQKVLGGPGQLMSETGSEGDPVHALTYQYNGNSLGSSAVFMFINGKLQSKFQAGLK